MNKLTLFKFHGSGNMPLLRPQDTQAENLSEDV